MYYISKTLYCENNMDQMEHNEEINLMGYLEVLWKRKWLIIIPTFLLVVIVGVVSFLITPIWEVDALIQPSKFSVQTQSGEFVEVIVIDPKQVAGLINQRSYNNLLAAELKIGQKEFPVINAEAIKDTKLVRTWIRDSDVKKATQIITALFARLKTDYDKKIEVEIKSIDAQITARENQIKENEIGIKEKENLIEYKKLLIKDRENEIHIRELEAQSKGIEKDRINKEIEIDRNKLKISEERQKSILDEMKSVKTRIDEIESQLQKSLADKKQGVDAIALLLYSNEVQQNLRYYNTLDEKISTERITRENINLSIRDNTEQLRQLDNQVSQIQAAIAIIKTEIEKVQNETITVKNDIEKIINGNATLRSDIQLLINKKTRIDYTTFIKEPTSSIAPVAPKKKELVLIAGALGLLIFGLIAYFLEYFKGKKASSKTP